MPDGTAPPAAICVDAPASTTHVPEPVVPMPTPMMIVDGGPAAVSVASTCPVVVTVNGWKLLPFTCTVPVSVSVVLGVDGVVVDVELELLVQLDTATASTMIASVARIRSA